jgi:hypothetical protein
MAGVVRERIKDWMRRRFPPRANYISVYECADVTQLLPPGAPTHGLESREGMVFASRDLTPPAPRKEIVILTSILANYSAERIISILERLVAPILEARAETRVLVGDELRMHAWGAAATDAAADEPCDAPQASGEPT